MIFQLSFSREFRPTRLCRIKKVLHHRVRVFLSNITTYSAYNRNWKSFASEESHLPTFIAHPFLILQYLGRCLSALHGSYVVESDSWHSYGNAEDLFAKLLFDSPHSRKVSCWNSSDCKKKWINTVLIYFFHLMQAKLTTFQISEGQYFDFICYTFTNF